MLTKKMLEILGNRQRYGAWAKNKMLRVAVVAMLAIGAMGVSVADAASMESRADDKMATNNIKKTFIKNRKKYLEYITKKYKIPSISLNKSSLVNSNV